MTRVWMEGSPGGSMWPMPPETWEQICSGKMKDFSGLFVRAEDALRLAAPAPDWCGSESGTPQRLEDDSGQPIHARVMFDTAASERAHEGNPLPCGSEHDESDFERRQRIADEIADRKLDQQHDNE